MRAIIPVRAALAALWALIATMTTAVGTLVVLAAEHTPLDQSIALGAAWLLAVVIAASLATGLVWAAATGGVSGDLGLLTRWMRQMAAQEKWDTPLPPPRTNGLRALGAALITLRAILSATVEGEREARKRAEAAGRYKAEFLASISHELRTPLNAILGFSQVLLDGIDGQLTDAQRQEVTLMRGAGKHLQALFREVIRFSAVTSGHAALDPAPVDVAALVTETAAMLEGQRRGHDRGHGVVIRTELSAELPIVWSDAVRVRQILTNLATNALVFTDTGTVVIAAREHADGVEIVVSDTGPGIAAEDVERIFEPYVQLTASRRRRRGTGLGLAISRELVRQLGGRMWVESEVGVGSAFHVVLPAGSSP